MLLQTQEAKWYPRYCLKSNSKNSKKKKPKSWEYMHTSYAHYIMQKRANPSPQCLVVFFMQRVFFIAEYIRRSTIRCWDPAVLTIKEVSLSPQSLVNAFISIYAYYFHLHEWMVIWSEIPDSNGVPFPIVPIMRLV